VPAHGGWQSAGENGMVRGGGAVHVGWMGYVHAKTGEIKLSLSGDECHHFYIQLISFGRVRM
jgi:hypothetical protein